MEREYRVLEYRQFRPNGPAELCTVFAERSLSRLSVILCHANVMRNSKEEHFSQRLKTALSNGSTRLGVFLARKGKKNRLAKGSSALYNRHWQSFNKEERVSDSKYVS